MNFDAFRFECFTEGGGRPVCRQGQPHGVRTVLVRNAHRIVFDDFEHTLQKALLGFRAGCKAVGVAPEELGGHTHRVVGVIDCVCRDFTRCFVQDVPCGAPLELFTDIKLAGENQVMGIDGAGEADLLIGRNIQKVCPEFPGEPLDGLHHRR